MLEMIGNDARIRNLWRRSKGGLERKRERVWKREQGKEWRWMR